MTAIERNNNYIPNSPVSGEGLERALNIGTKLSYKLCPRIFYSSLGEKRLIEFWALAKSRGDEGTVDYIRDHFFQGKNPIVVAAKVQSSPAVTRVFIEAGYCIDGRDTGGRTALIHAAGRGQEETVRLLLKHKASLNLQSNLGNTALIHAACCGNEEIVNLLLNNNALLNIQNDLGETALIKTIANIVKLHRDPEQEEIMRPPLWVSSMDQWRDEDYDTVIHRPELSRHTKTLSDIATRLLNKGANPNIYTQNEDTALLLTAQIGQFYDSKVKVENLTKLLLSKGANPNASDRNGETPLFHATRHLNYGAVCSLTESWLTDLHHKNRNGQSAEEIDPSLPTIDLRSRPGESSQLMINHKGWLKACQDKIKEVKHHEDWFGYGRREKHRKQRRLRLMKKALEKLTQFVPEAFLKTVPLEDPSPKK